MLSGEGMQRRKKVKNNNIGLISNSNFARAAQYFCTFLCLCFARLQLETSRNFLVTRFMEEMSHVFPFTAAHFHLALVFRNVALATSEKAPWPINLITFTCSLLISQLLREGRRGM